MLSKLLEYLLEEELEEQNVLSAGGVAATSTGIALDATNFRPPPKRNLNEINTVYNGGLGMGFFDKSSNDMDAAQEDADMGENASKGRPDRGRDRADNKKRKFKKKKFQFRKSKQGYDATADTMWNYGDKPTGDIPATRIKYIAIINEPRGNLPKSLNESFHQKKKLTITCDRPLKTKSLETIVDFIKFCNGILKIEELPTMHLHTVKKPEMTTGMYKRDDNTMHVLLGKRLIVDVLRTIAHELTHRRQDETGLLAKHLANIDPVNEMGDIDTIYENEAYTLAGNIVKIFCRKYPKITKDELYQLNENKL